MYCGTDRQGWDKFWKNRKPLTFKQLTPFYNNFACMMGVIQSCGLATRVENIRGICFSDKAVNKSILEVGAGRGTLSELFRQKGFKTFCTDIKNRIAYPRYDFPFVENDILESSPFAPEQFDITFTYGLLEHFKPHDRNIIIERCLEMTRPGGLSMHYVVPKKWSNLREDKSVYRDRCKDLMCNPGDKLKFRDGGIKYVYPGLGSAENWECGKFLSKGFIWWAQKWLALDKLIREGIARDIEHQLGRRNVLLENIT